MITAEVIKTSSKQARNWGGRLPWVNTITRDLEVLQELVLADEHPALEAVFGLDDLEDLANLAKEVPTSETILTAWPSKGWSSTGTAARARRCLPAMYDPWARVPPLQLVPHLGCVSGVAEHARGSAVEHLMAAWRAACCAGRHV